MTRKLSSEEKLKRAIAALDTAVQHWYDDNCPGDEERYADVSIFNRKAGDHISNITLKTSPGHYLTIESRREKRVDI